MKTKLFTISCIAASMLASHTAKADVITMQKDEATTEVRLQILPTSTSAEQELTIAWGDNVTETIKLDSKGAFLSHTYAEATAASIQINAQNIVEFDCSGNGITSVVLQTPSLQTLRCTNNALTGLDLNNAPEVTYLDCSENQLVSITCPETSKMEQLNVSYNPAFASSVTIAQSMPELKWLNINGTNTSEVALTSNEKLERLYVSGCGATNIQLSAQTNLKYLDCSSNSLNALDLGAQTKLTELYCENNAISSLNVTPCTALEYVDADNNGMTSFTSSNSKLIQVNISNNKINSFPATEMAKLATLYYAQNEISELQLPSSSSKFRRLDVSYNNLESIDVTPIKKFRMLDCSNNKLTEVVTNATTCKMSGFSCKNNKLTFATLPDQGVWDAYFYAPQAWFELPTSVDDEMKMDLSSQFVERIGVLGSTATPVKPSGLYVRDAETEKAYSISGYSKSLANGTITFKLAAQHDAFCYLTSKAFPAFVTTGNNVFRSNSFSVKPTSIESVEEIASLPFTIENGKVVVEGGVAYSLTTIDGKRLSKNTSLKNGVYIVTIGDNSWKIALD